MNVFLEQPRLHCGALDLVNNSGGDARIKVLILKSALTPWLICQLSHGCIFVFQKRKEKQNESNLATNNTLGHQNVKINLVAT